MLRRTLNRLVRLAANDRGTVAVLFGLMVIPLAIAIGAGIDYGRALQIRATLQNTVDAAALSGASAYTAPSTETTAQTLAQNYVAKGTAALPSGVTVTSTTVTPGQQGNGNNVAYTMYASITASVPTTFMSFYESAITVTASATATNPVVNATFDMGSFVSYACDTNEIYWYIVPSGGGVPDASAMNLLWSNNDANPTTITNFSVAASAQIGFAIKNVTGARPQSLGGCNYGNNMYGSQAGDTQWLYSSLQPPSEYYNIAPGGTNTGTHGVYETTQDCALYVEKGKYKNGAWSYSSAPQGHCYTSNGKNENENTYDDQGNMDGVCDACSKGSKMSTAMTNAAPSCSALGGKSYQYNWNDMGGSFDSYNYGNDMQYSFSCSGGAGSGNGTSTSGVVLTN